MIFFNDPVLLENPAAQALRMADVQSGLINPALCSRLFVYYNSRRYDGENPVVDAGTQLRSGAQGVMRFGRPPESAWPFRMNAVNLPPPWEAYREAYDYKGPAGYYRVVGVDEIKQALAAGKPVVGGVEVAASIQSYTGGIYDPSPSEPIIGGHALCFTGYTSSYFEIVNSWGPTYGESGFLRVSYAFAAQFSDCWAVSK